jgi:arabinan endo-1,5-alpha-L-arabinosidase
MVISLLCVLLFPGVQLLGLQGRTGAHDPTAIQKCGDTYWIFTTGNGIYSMYSRDLISWTAGKTPFTRSVYPSWINSYVPGFEGHFWAPECVFMNGKYHLYYSCSTWGSKVSCIGLVTNETLNPDDPGFLWQDQGVVVFSNEGSSANCIDPSVFRTEEGDYYLTYGSYFGGIRIVQLDSLTGKVSGDYHYPVASGNTEASYVIPHEGYYYLFINRGTCCQGVNSTYHIQVGRCEEPTGPFLDKTGTDLNAGGGSTILSTSGNFIGPGHTGYYVENGEEWVTYHYYDGDRNGTATLAIGTMRWEEEGWPRITNEFLEEGDYLLVNHNSQLVIQTGEPAEEGGAVTQGSYTGGTNQSWHLTPVGSGYYSFTPGDGSLVIETEGCSTTSGSPLVVGTDQFMPCEHWRIERTSFLEYVISCRAGNHVMDVPPPAFGEGIQLQASIFTGLASQYWQVKDSLAVTVDRSSSGTTEKGFRIHPNPYRGGPLCLVPDEPLQGTLRIEIYSLDGRCLLREIRMAGEELELEPVLGPGMYSIRVITDRRAYDKKFISL